MSCLCCQDLREKLEAIERSLTREGFAFVSLKGRMELVQKTRHDCVYINSEKTFHCWSGACASWGCNKWEHKGAE